LSQSSFKDPIQLSIVVVNWNGSQFLRRCVHSIVQSPPSIPFEIIVVDNASTDDSVSWLRETVSQGLLGSVDLRLIENSENVGFGTANNQAFARSDAPLLLLLNNDTEVRSEAIDSLIATVRSSSRIAACGPRMINSDGSLQVSAWRTPPTAWEILISGLRLYWLLPRRVRGELLLGKHWDHSRRRDVGMLSAAALLIKREVINEIGGFDERFHMYAEDDEWCFRARRAGWRLVFEPRATVIHHGARSALARWTEIERQLRIADAGLKYQRHSLSRPHFILNLLANYLVVSLAYLFKSLTGRSTNETRLKLRLYARYLRQMLMKT
jgi:GT2 family glycosyltransferase